MSGLSQSHLGKAYLSAGKSKQVRHYLCGKSWGMEAFDGTKACTLAPEHLANHVAR